MSNAQYSSLRDLPVSDQVVIAALSGFEDLMSDAMAKAPLTPELRHLALRLAQDAGHDAIISMLTLH